MGGGIVANGEQGSSKWADKTNDEILNDVNAAQMALWQTTAYAALPAKMTVSLAVEEMLNSRDLVVYIEQHSLVSEMEKQSDFPVKVGFAVVADDALSDHEMWLHVDVPDDVKHLDEVQPQRWTGIA